MQDTEVRAEAQTAVCPLTTGRIRLLPPQVRRLREAAKLRKADLLAELLREAEAEHHAHEQMYGPDPDWATWYAKYLTGRLS